MISRAYVCHTFYHVYVTIMKECALPESEAGKADIILSNISSDIFPLAEPLRKSGFFHDVLQIEEKKDSFFEKEGLMEYKKPCGNILKHLRNRIIYTRKLAELEEPFITVDFTRYSDIYVFCDSDPIGYYLNRKHIYYHAVEDGLDCLKYLDGAYYDNRSFFKLKTLLSALNIIFIQNGYGKYCLDMEVNDLSCLRRVGKNYRVVSRRELEKGMTDEQKVRALKVFLPGAEEFISSINSRIKSENRKCILFLTMPHPKEEEKRIQICNDIIRDYCAGAHVVIKPHPRDLIDYASLRPDCTVINGKFPVEVLNFLPGVEFDKIISIATTAIDNLQFAREKINLGAGFWDAYEEPEKHNWEKV